MQQPALSDDAFLADVALPALAGAVDVWWPGQSGVPDSLTEKYAGSERPHVKSGWVETPEVVEERVRAALDHVPPERLSVSPDCGLSQTARWAAQGKLASLVEGARRAREAV